MAREVHLQYRTQTDLLCNRGFVVSSSAAPTEPYPHWYTQQHPSRWLPALAARSLCTVFWLPPPTKVAAVFLRQLQRSLLCLADVAICGY
jgi:hypothetical protein